MKKKKALSAIAAFILLFTPALSGCSGEKVQTNPYNPLLPASSTSDVTSRIQPTESSAEPSDSSTVPQPSDVSTPEPSTPIPQTSDYSDVTPAVWKVENSAGNYIYMMGTIHMGDDSVEHLPSYVWDAYNYSDSIAVEADISAYLEDQSKAVELISVMTYNDGTTIKDHISEKTYNAAVEQLTNAGMYSPAYDRMRPFIWTSMLSSTIQADTGLDIYKGVDMKFIKQAQTDNKPIIEIESVEQQFELFNQYSDELNELMISQMLDPNYGTNMAAATKMLYERWKTGTIDTDLLINTTFIEDDEQDYPLYEEYLEKLLYSRNAEMAKSAEQFVDAGQKVFFMVGTLHFCGDKGIVALLQNDGYTVTRVTS